MQVRWVTNQLSNEVANDLHFEYVFMLNSCSTSIALKLKAFISYTNTEQVVNFNSEIHQITNNSIN